jgi:hypothetical protein
MAHQWDRGVLTASSWHGLEEVGALAGADGMIAKGLASGAWPSAVRFDEAWAYRRETGLWTHATGWRSVVASYQAHADRCLGMVGDRYTATTPDEWQTLVRAAVDAGARPTGAFSLAGGTRVLATFEVGESNGLRTQLLLADAFDGTMHLTCGTTSVRVVCANTLSSAMRADGKDMAKLRHTASLPDKVAILAKSIGQAITDGAKVRAAYQRAEQTVLSRADAERAFDLLFPRAPRDAAKGAVTRADNARAEAIQAMQRPENNAGTTLATLWNAATWLVDRTGDGKPRPTRGEAEALDSLLFGSRAERVQEVQTIVQVIMRDGSIQDMTAPEAARAGVDARTMGASVLDAMLSE